MSLVLMFNQVLSIITLLLTFKLGFQKGLNQYFLLVMKNTKS